MKTQNIFKCICITQSLCLICFVISAYSDQQTAESGSALYEKQNGQITEDTEYDEINAGIRMLVALMIVLALIFAGVFLLKKLTRYKDFAGNSKHPVTVLSSIPMGNKRSIAVVRIADKILIIGMTNTNMSLLSKMNVNDYYLKDNMVSGKDYGNMLERTFFGGETNFIELLKKARESLRFRR